MIISETLEHYFKRKSLYDLNYIYESSDKPLELLSQHIKECINSILREEHSHDLQISKIIPLFNEEFLGNNKNVIALGNYEIHFDRSTIFKGNIQATFEKDDRKYTLVNIILGDLDLKYKGNEPRINLSDWR